MKTFSGLLHLVSIGPPVGKIQTAGIVIGKIERVLHCANMQERLLKIQERAREASRRGLAMDMNGDIDFLLRCLAQTEEERALAVTRLEVVDYTGRCLVKETCEIKLSFQDDGRTLKVFVTEAK